MAFPNPNAIFSASRDATVRLWKLVSSPPPSYDYSITTHGQAFINSLAYLPPSSDYPDGLVISGGQDTIIEARQPGKSVDDNADAMLLGHGHNICALDVSPDGQWIVSGSWDSTARLWRVGKWEADVVLQGHGASVWAVLAYDKDTIITGKMPTRTLSGFGRAGNSMLTLYFPCRLCRPNDPRIQHFRSAPYKFQKLQRRCSSFVQGPHLTSEWGTVCNRKQRRHHSTVHSSGQFGCFPSRP